MLGFLLGHECAHAVLRHGGEALAQAPLFELAGLLATSLVSSIIPISETVKRRGVDSEGIPMAPDDAMDDAPDLTRGSRGCGRQLALF